MRRIALFGVFACGNLGNDATLEAMLANIARFAPNVEVTCICPDPQLIRQRYGIDAIPIDIEPQMSDASSRSLLPDRVARVGARVRSELGLWRALAAQLHSFDHLLFTGTGVLDDFGVRPWNLPYDLYKWCTLAHRAGTHIAFVSVGAGPILQAGSRWLMLAALRQAEYRSYRDDLSRQYLATVGFDSHQDRVYPDLVFSLPPDQLPAHKLPALPAHAVGVGLMGYYGWRNSQHSGGSIYATYIAKMKQFVAWLIEQGYAVHLLTGEVPTDDRAREEVVEHVRSTCAAESLARIHMPPIGSTYELLTAIAATDIVVATRYHNVISALLLGRPVVSAGYSKKNDVLLADMGLGAYCQHVESLDVARLQDQFTALTADAAAAGDRVRRTVVKYQSQLAEQYTYLFASQT